MRMIVGLTLILLFPTASVFGEDTLTEVGHKPRLKNEKKIKASFAKLAPMLAKLPDDSDLTLYQGLPRHRGSVDEQDAQYDAKSMIKMLKVLHHLIQNRGSPRSKRPRLRRRNAVISKNTQ